jgi:leucine efflux protein
MSFYGVTDLWTYVVGAIGIVLLPGPNSLFVLSVATVRGAKLGYRAAFGVFLGDAILLALTALGAAQLLHSYPTFFLLIKYVGAAYLTWVGLLLIWATWRQWRALPGTQAAPESAANLQQPFRRALVISLLNPKAILFLLSFFVQFIDPSYPLPFVPFLILAVILMVFSALYLSALILASTRLVRQFGKRRGWSASLSGAVGALFVWFGSKLANASLG